ncbi:MAG: hypothetical protein HYV27_13265 [Candidatus Hydrogenedentes bacterium]|nr:hypothetical protein [Candidatus Hydrogenedentota bacterium]
MKMSNGLAKCRSWGLCLVLLLCAGVSAQDEKKPGGPPAITADQLPALLHLEQELPDRPIHVQLAYRNGEEWAKRTLVSRPYAAAAALAKGRVLIVIGESPQSTEVFLANPVAGRLSRISKNKFATPFNGNSALGQIRYGLDGTFVRMLREDILNKRVELLSFATQLPVLEERYVDRKHFGTALEEGLPMRIAPDGRHIALLTAGKQEGRYDLQVLHVLEDSTSTVSPDIGKFQDGPAVGFDWMDKDTLLFAVAGAPGEARFATFKIHANELSPLFNSNLPPLTGGLAMQYEGSAKQWFIESAGTGDRPYLLHLASQTIVNNPDPTRLSLVALEQGFEVRRGASTVFSGEQNVAGLWSASTAGNTHVAMALEGVGVPAPDQRMAMYIIAGGSEAVMVGKPAHVLQPLGWVTRETGKP